MPLFLEGGNGLYIGLAAVTGAVRLDGGASDPSSLCAGLRALSIARSASSGCASHGEAEDVGRLVPRLGTWASRRTCHSLANAG